MSMPPITLLGPQRFNPHVADVFSQAKVDGSIALITAGWQEREAEINELSEHLKLPTQNLALYQRGDQLFSEHSDFHRDYRARQSMLRRLQRLYRTRLERLLDSARVLMRAENDELIDEARDAAIEDVRRLDEHHLNRIEKTHLEFRQTWPLDRLPELVRHRNEIQEILGSCTALCIAGGHVVVLLNRLRLFGIKSLIQDLPIVAWSAGAMAIAERIVLFHDSPPQGAGNPEVLETGLALFKGLVPLPHAKRRLRLQDSVRVSLFSKRFEPRLCLTLDEGAQAQYMNDHWTHNQVAQVLSTDGTISHMDGQ